MASREELRQMFADYCQSAIPVNKPMLQEHGLCATLVYHKLLSENIQNYQEENDGWFYLKMDYIYKSTGYGKTQIWKAVNALKENELIETRSENGKITWFRVKRFTKRTGTRSQSEPVFGPASLYINKKKTNKTETPLTPQGGHGEVDENRKTQKQEQNQPTAQSRSFAPDGGRGCGTKSKRTSIPGAKKYAELRSNDLHGKVEPAEQKTETKPTAHLAELRSSTGYGMRKTRPGQTRKDLLPTPCEAQDLPAHARSPKDPLAKYTQEELEFAHSWYRYIKDRFTEYRSKTWKDLRISWLEGIRKVTTNKKVKCTFEELVTFLEWAKTDPFLSKNIRSLARLDKKWGADSIPLVDKLRGDYEMAHKKSAPKASNEPLDMQEEIPRIVERTLLDTYDGHEDYFDPLCDKLSETIVSIWDLLDSHNQRLAPADRQTWLYNKLFLEKCVEIVNIWVQYSNGKDPMLWDFSYGLWARFRKRVLSWKENVATQGIPGPWIINKI